MTTQIPSLGAAPWLTAAPTQRVLRLLGDAGYEGRAVGGVVRNALLGLAVTDIDIATTAEPPEVIRLARAAGLAVVETGIDHGTVTVIADHHPFEVTTLRRDVSTDGRRATVAFTHDWVEDAGRRDFTMNALYCDAAGRVYDPLGGYPDLAARRVRFIGDAAARIREDYLRILRFFRFSAQYGEGPLDTAGLTAATRERDGLSRLSPERIRQELVRLLVARRAVDHVEAMQAHGILACVLPVAPRTTLLARIAAIEAGHGLAPDAALRLAALAVDTAEDAERLEAALRLSGDERAVLRLSTRSQARRAEAPSERDGRALLFRHEPSDYRRNIVLSWARDLRSSPRDRLWSAALTLPDRWTPPRFPVDGGDVMARGVPSGPAVGQALAALKAWWIAADFRPDRSVLLDRLDAILRDSA